MSRELNTRQWRLYDFIEKNGKVSVEDICNALPQYYTLNTNPYIHDKCILVRQDIETINFYNEKIMKIIISDRNYNYWLARDSEEARTYIKKRYQSVALRRFKKFWSIIDKCELNGQGRLLDSDGNVIDEKSRAKRFVETFAQTFVDDLDKKSEKEKGL